MINSIRTLAVLIVLLGLVVGFDQFRLGKLEDEVKLLKANLDAEIHDIGADMKKLDEKAAHWWKISRGHMEGMDCTHLQCEGVPIKPDPADKTYDLEEVLRIKNGKKR